MAVSLPVAVSNALPTGHEWIRPNSERHRTLLPRLWINAASVKNSQHDPPMTGAAESVQLAAALASPLSSESAKLPILLVHGAKSRDANAEALRKDEVQRVLKKYYCMSLLVSKLRFHRLTESAVVVCADTHEILMVVKYADTAESTPLMAKIQQVAADAAEVHRIMALMASYCYSRSRHTQKDNGRLLVLGMRFPRYLANQMYAYYSAHRRLDPQQRATIQAHYDRIACIERMLSPSGAAAREACRTYTMPLGMFEGTRLPQHGPQEGAASSEGYVSLWHQDDSNCYESIVFSNMPEGDGCGFCGLRAGVVVDISRGPCVVMVPGNDMHGTPYSDEQFRRVGIKNSRGIDIEAPNHGGIGQVIINKTRSMSSPAAEIVKATARAVAAATATATATPTAGPASHATPRDLIRQFMASGTARAVPASTATATRKRVREQAAPAAAFAVNDPSTGAISKLSALQGDIGKELGDDHALSLGWSVRHVGGAGSQSRYEYTHPTLGVFNGKKDARLSALAQARRAK